MPVAAQKADGEIIVVLDSDAVGEHVFVVQRIGILRLVERFHADSDAFCYLLDHDLCKNKQLWMPVRIFCMGGEILTSSQQMACRRVRGGFAGCLFPLPQTPPAASSH